MKKQGALKIILFCLTLVLALFINSTSTFAQNLSLEPQNTIKNEETLSDQIKKKLKRGALFLLGIESKLKNSDEELELIKNNMRLLEERIKESKVKITDLSSQLTNLERLSQLNEEKIQAGTLQIAAYENSIAILEEHIREKEKELKKELTSLNRTVTAFYFQNNLFFETDDKIPNLLAFFAAEKDVGQILQENTYLSFLQTISQTLLKEIIETELALDEERSELKGKKGKLFDLQTLLAREKRTLTAARQSRQRLLEETRGRQVIYESLLQLSKKEAQQVFVQIQKLQENYSFFEEKLKELENQPERLKFQLDKEALQQNESKAPLLWPVSPILGLSAFFHDDAYEKALGIPHNAIDIRLIQGSQVKSSADGVITKVADNGFAYSYIIIGHPGGLLTLYGHMSEIFVEEGQLVRQGQTIGLSGGIPGTKGAGWLTTGAHLHFEVFKNFQHADPLEYLPLEYVPIASLPEKYLKKLTGEDEKVKRK